MHIAWHNTSEYGCGKLLGHQYFYNETNECICESFGPECKIYDLECSIPFWKGGVICNQESLPAALPCVSGSTYEHCVCIHEWKYGVPPPLIKHEQEDVRATENPINK